MQLKRSRSARTYAHTLGKAFHAVFACHDHRCCEQRCGSAHYAFGCGLQTRAQSCLGIFRLPAPWLGPSASSERNRHETLPTLLDIHNGTRQMTAGRLWLRVNLKLKTSLKSICASASLERACRLSWLALAAIPPVQGGRPGERGSSNYFGHRPILRLFCLELKNVQLWAVAISHSLVREVCRHG